MNYCDEIKRALCGFDENHAMMWVRLTKADLRVIGNPDPVTRKLMGCSSLRPHTGSVGITGAGVPYIFHKDRWRKVLRGRAGKHRLEGSLRK